MVVNNWHVITEAVLTTRSRWARLCFVSFRVLAVLVVINIVVAFILECSFCRDVPRVPQVLTDRAFVLRLHRGLSHLAARCSDKLT